MSDAHPSTSINNLKATFNLVRKTKTEKGQSGWTLFLDRDGVLNRKIEAGYVLNPEMLEVLPGTATALIRFSDFFDRILIVTNQRGIGRGWMTEADLGVVHTALLERLGKEAAEKIDAIYYCPHDYNAKCRCRKPGPGMPEQAQAQYPEINFRRALMIGDSPSDMEMGLKLGMACIFIGKKSPMEGIPAFESLIHFITWLADG